MKKSQRRKRKPEDLTMHGPYKTVLEAFVDMFGHKCKSKKWARRRNKYFVSWVKDHPEDLEKIRRFGINL